MQAQFRIALSLGALFISITLCTRVSAQTAQDAGSAAEASASTSVPIVPQQVRYAGKLPTRSGDTVEAVFRIYSAQEGGEPIWTETQHIAIGEDGSYTVLLGSAAPSGLPQTVFAGGAARWLGVSVERGPEAERTLLSSVPYAMKSADAESLAGHPARDFVTQEQLLALQPTQPATAPQPETGGTVTGSGTTNTVPLWASSSAIGNSVITQSGKSIGIGIATPASTLDVDGGVTVRGDLNLPAPAKATASKGQPSNLFEFTSSAWNSSSSAAQGETFFMVADPTGNDTASPSATLNFQFKNGSAAPATVFSVAGDGIMTFSPAQTFPGTIGSITAGTGIVSAASGNNVTLSIDPNVVPTLNGNNSFPGTTSMYSRNSQPGLSVENSNSAGGNALDSATLSGIGVLAYSYQTNPGDAGVVGYLYTTTGSYASLAATTAAGVWGDAQPYYGTSTPVAGVIGTADDAAAAIFMNNSANDSDAVQVTANGANTNAITAVANQGYAMLGTSQSGNGISGVSVAQDAGTAGVLGVSYGASQTYLSMKDKWTGGVWGDTLYSNLGSGYTAGIVGTTDNTQAGYFVNNSFDSSTLVLMNNYPDGPTDSNIYSAMMASTPNGICGIGGGGDLSCTGRVKSLVSVDNGSRKVETYSMQSPENWMEDFGSGKLERGVAVVKLDPTFAETVSESAEYHVFLTPKGDSKGLYVINETPSSFEVRESGGGVSYLAFDYRIVGKRRGFENQRHVDVTKQYKAAIERNSGNGKPREAAALRAPRILNPRRTLPIAHPAQTSPAVSQPAHLKIPTGALAQ